MKKVQVWCVIDNRDIAFIFRWDEEENCWVCKMEDSFMQDLGPLLVTEEDKDDVPITDNPPRILVFFSIIVLPFINTFPVISVSCLSA
jgi:hypothetical protein